MKLPSFMKTKEQLKQGDAVMIFAGRGCLPGIIVFTDKRKSKVRLKNNIEKIIENNKIRVVTDFKFREEIIRTVVPNYLNPEH